LTENKKGPPKRKSPMAAFYPMGDTVFIVMSNLGLKTIKKGKTLDGTIAGNDKALSMKIMSEKSFESMKATVINKIHKREIIDKKDDETVCTENQS